MRRNNTSNNNGKTVYEVIGTDDSIYLSREDRYLKNGEELELMPAEAEMLLAAGLVQEKTAYSAPAPDIETQEE